IALRMAKARIPSVLVARTDEEISAVRNEIVSDGGKAWACPCDITQPGEVLALKEDIESELGTVNILINNAGVAPSAKFESTTDEMWRETFAVNVDGAFYMTRAFVPAMRITNGQIISIASSAALQGFRYTAAYTASKHALLGLMRALAEELGGTKIKVSTICPGFVRTSILENSIENIVGRTGKSKEEAEHIFAAMNREAKIIEPGQIAETVFQLISDRNLQSGLAYYEDGTVIDGKK
ncbi:MAG TPA: SDR family oxidoreductase, partial [Candidatus Kapabacteria bacterium]|nr:SDR family oxidoreductase [Candidatus Kapabacteria bacterium]